MRRFYAKQHRFYCGIDLHARLLAICIVDHDNASVVCRTQIPADRQLLLDTLAPYQNAGLVAGGGPRLLAKAATAPRRPP